MMDSIAYLDIFKQAADKLPKEPGLEIETGIWLNSVVLRVQKEHWRNKLAEKAQTDSAIFFSIWLNEDPLKNSKLLYNIHALKLRQLKGYKLTSRKFAAAFRAEFKKVENKWPNVSVDFGPQTLMQGWVPFNFNSLETDVLKLATGFLAIQYLIDDLLEG